jgi:hypothetical protein
LTYNFIFDLEILPQRHQCALQAVPAILARGLITPKGKTTTRCFCLLQ